MAKYVDKCLRKVLLHFHKKEHCSNFMSCEDHLDFIPEFCGRRIEEYTLAVLGNMSLEEQELVMTTFRFYLHEKHKDLIKGPLANEDKMMELALDVLRAGIRVFQFNRILYGSHRFERNNEELVARYRRGEFEHKTPELNDF